LNKNISTCTLAFQRMSVPRFTDEMLVPIKRVMLARQPTFVLTPADVEALVQETGLVKAQVQKWAENFRRRYTTDKERMDVLTTDGPEKVT
jgi:hypothetical protein